MTKAKKAVWDEVASVEPKTSTEKPPVSDDPEEGVPFGSKSVVQKVIVAYRKHFRESAPEKRGQGTSPDGTVYNYYLSSDVFDHADEFVSKEGFILELHNSVVDGVNIMQLALEHINSGVQKVVSVNLGTPKSVADLGARITYAPKYLIAIMFGISVQTDTDAFGNGRVKGDEPQVQNVTSTPEVTTTAPVTTTGEPSKSYQKAREFIEKATLVEMLDQAAVKVDNSTQMSDEEKSELTNLISEKKNQLS